MNRPDENDELIRRYREAGAQDTRRPSPQIGEAVRAHARMVAASKAASPTAPSAAAANQSRWKISLIASIALAGLTGLLVLQFDRGTADEQEMALGRPAPAVVPASPASPPPAVADATVARSETPAARPVTPTPATRAAIPTTRPAPDAGRPAPATASPVPPAEPAPSPLSLAGQEAPAPARERRADALRDQASEKAMPAAAPQAMTRGAATAPALRMPAPAPPQESLTAQAPRSAPALAAALHQAARAGQLATLEALLQQGAPVNAPDGAGRTALSLAVIHGHGELVRRLLALGANPALVDRDGLDALQHARRLGREDMVRLIEGRS